MLSLGRDLENTQRNTRMAGWRCWLAGGATVTEAPFHPRGPEMGDKKPCCATVYLSHPSHMGGRGPAVGISSLSNCQMASGKCRLLDIKPASVQKQNFFPVSCDGPKSSSGLCFPVLFSPV